MGRVNVNDMMAEMSLPQFYEWQAYYQLEPWCEERADIRAAQICAVIANKPVAGMRRRTKRFKITDFLLFKPVKTVKEKWDALKGFFMGMTAKKNDEETQ